MKQSRSVGEIHFPLFAKAVVSRGNFKMIVLAVLQERPMHGYEVSKVIQEQSRGFYKPSAGSIYPALQSLLKEGYVKVSKSDRRKIYQITAAGRNYLQSQHEEIERAMKSYTDSLGPDRAALMTEMHKTAKLTAIASRDMTPEQIRKLVKVCADAREKMLRILSE